MFPTKSAKTLFSTFHIIKTSIHINCIFTLQMTIGVGNIMPNFDFRPCGCLGNIGFCFPISHLKCHHFNQMCIFRLKYLQNLCFHFIPECVSIHPIISIPQYNDIMMHKTWTLPYPWALMGLYRQKIWCVASPPPQVLLLQATLQHTFSSATLPFHH